LMMSLLAGCGEQPGRYQLVPIPPGTVWRIDTVTGPAQEMSMRR
jgi:hypothetical protein